MSPETLRAIAAVAAMKIGKAGMVIDTVARSKNGVYCLMCLQEHYGQCWTSMDNGTYYCDEHRKKLRERYESVQVKV